MRALGRPRFAGTGPTDSLWRIGCQGAWLDGPVVTGWSGVLGEAARDAQRAEVVFAALGHLLVVGAGELGVLLAGGVGGADQGGAQQRGSGLGHGLALAVGLAGLRCPGDQAGVGAELLAGGEP